MSKVIEISDGLQFDTGEWLQSRHDTGCCESHWLDFDAIDLSDFEGLEFDLHEDGRFFERVEGYGIRLKPTNGHPVFVAGYGSNNGHYSNEIELVLTRPNDAGETTWDVTECQEECDE